MSSRLVPRSIPSIILAVALAAPNLTIVAQSRPVDAAHFKGLKYRMVGPARGGRVTTVTGVVQEPHTFYMGATGGGVWKTTDAGAPGST